MCYLMTTFRCPSDILITSWLFTAWCSLRFAYWQTESRVIIELKPFWRTVQCRRHYHSGSRTSAGLVPLLNRPSNSSSRCTRFTSKPTPVTCRVPQEYSIVTSQSIQFIGHLGKTLWVTWPKEASQHWRTMVSQPGQGSIQTGSAH